MKSPAKQSAGALKETVAFDKRIEENPDSPVDAGNTVSSWTEQFTERAGFTHLRGGEAVLAGRLQGRHILVARLRKSDLTDQVTTDWRMRDTQAGTYYAIRDKTPYGQWVDFLCESGVAT